MSYLALVLLILALIFGCYRVMRFCNRQALYQRAAHYKQEAFHLVNMVREGGLGEGGLGQDRRAWLDDANLMQFESERIAEHLRETDALDRLLLKLGQLRFAASTPLREGAHSILNLWGAVLPARVNEEDLGNYIEDIDRRADRGERWGLIIRVIAAVFWTFLAAIGYALKMLGRSKAA